MGHINIEITPSRMEEHLKYHIQNNVKLASEGKNPVSIEFQGEAGLGKTSIVEQIAQEFKKSHNFVKLSVSQLSIEDLVGFPFIAIELCNDKKECIWIKDNQLSQYLASGYILTGRTETTYAVPKWFVFNDNKPIIICLDDYSRANQQVIQACMDIVDRGSFSTWALPKGSTVVLTTNPDNSDYIINVEDNAQTSRRLKYSVKANVEDWSKYAESAKINEKIINFLLKNKEVIEGTGKNKDGTVNKKGNLRIWTKFADAISGISNFSDGTEKDTNWQMVFEMGQGSIPIEDLLLFNQFIQDKLDKIMPIEDIFKKDSKDVIKHLKSIIGKGSNTRNDIKALIIKRINNYIESFHKEFDKDMINNYWDLMEEDDLFAKDMVLMSIASYQQKLKIEGKTCLDLREKINKIIYSSV